MVHWIQPSRRLARWLLPAAPDRTLKCNGGTPGGHPALTRRRASPRPTLTSTEKPLRLNRPYPSPLPCPVQCWSSVPAAESVILGSGCSRSFNPILIIDTLAILYRSIPKLPINEIRNYWFNYGFVPNIVVLPSLWRWHSVELCWSTK